MDYDHFAVESNPEVVSIIDAEGECVAISYKVLPDLIRQLTDHMVNHYRINWDMH